MLREKQRILFCALTTLAFARVHASGSLADIQAQLDGGRATQAYDIAKSIEDREMGEPNFDFSYGLAARESGHYKEAVFAFERVIAKLPSNGRAKLELAYTYYKMKRYAEAKTGFEEVLATNPPLAVRNNILPLLQVASLRANVPKYTKNLSVSLGTGFDSNANAGTSSYQIFVPNLGNVVLNKQSRRGRSDFGSFGLNGGITYNIDKQRSIPVTLAVNLRDNFHAHLFDNYTYQFGTGYRYRTGPYTFNIPVSISRMLLHGKDFRENPSVGMNLTRVLTPKDVGSVAASYDRIRFVRQSPQSVNSKTVNLNWIHSFTDTMAALMKVGRGWENATQRYYRYNGRHYNTIGLGGFWKQNNQTMWFCSVDYLHAHYNTQNPIFASLRIDNLWNYSAGVEHKLNDRWSIRSDYRHSRNSSSMALYKFHRSMIEALLQYRFA